MSRIPKIDYYLKILTNVEVKDFVAINFSEYFKTIKEEQNFTEFAKLLYIFLRTPDEVEKYMESIFSDNCVRHYNVNILNLFHPELQVINSKRVVKNKLDEFLSELKKFTFQTMSVLHSKKRNDHEIFHSSAKLIASNSYIDETFKSMHQSIMAKVKNYSSEDCIVLDVIIKHSMKIFEKKLKKMMGITSNFYTD